MVRRHLAARADACVARTPQRRDRLGGGEVQEVQRLVLVPGEREIALDHHRLGDRRVAREAELGRDGALVHVAAVREALLLAVQREQPAGDGRVLQRAAHQAGRADGNAVVGERDRAGVGELGHLGQLRPVLAARDRGEEADLHLRLAARSLDQRAEHRRRVDDRIGVRHREDRAVAARGRRSRPARDRLLVLASRRAQMHVRVDERGREHEPGCVDDAMPVRVDLLGDRSDDAVVDAHVEDRVDSLGGVDDARAAEHDVLARTVSAEEHHATSAAASARTPTGPPVSTS